MNLVLLSLNINSDRRLEKEWINDERYRHTVHAFGKLSIEERFSVLVAFLQEQILQKQVQCFALQEIDEKAKLLLERFFKEIQFNVIFTKYCPHKDAYYYAFAYNPQLCSVKETKQIYFTESGLPTSDEDRLTLTLLEKKKRHLEQEFEKSAQLIRLIKDNSEFVIINLQAGTVPNKHRELAMAKLVKDLAQEELPIILIGDFNQFDARLQESKIHEEQVNILRESGFHWTSEALMNLGIKSTFYAFPHDIERLLDTDLVEQLKKLKLTNDYDGIRNFFLTTIQEKNLQLESTCLDAVYDKNFPSGSIIKIKSVTRVCNESITTSKITSESFRNKCMQGYMRLFNGQDSEPPLPSDHVGLRVTIKI